VTAFGRTQVAPRKVRVLRIIARLNIGGPAHHVSILSGRLDPERFETRLLAGRLGAGEGSFEELAARHGADLHFVDGLGPELDPAADARALRSLVAAMRSFRPHIVHTHTAKAGTLGRLAARIALGPRPVVVHTYHGHVLTGYFGPVKSAMFRGVERALAPMTNRLIGVSAATVDELVALRIANRTRFSVIPIGLDLDAFLDADAGDGAAFRNELSAGPDDVLAVFVGRLAPIKRVDVLLRAMAIARERAPALRLAVVGDGELRDELEAQAAALGISGAVTFCGFRDDLPRIASACDIAVLSSDNEGTPVALIEAAAAGRPAVSTNVGGVADIVKRETGFVVAPGDAAGLAAGMVHLVADPALRERMGAAARAHVRDRYGAERLVRDIAELYTELLPRPRS
jgi:glycosyltransferase involved in cell wall biosynthesis